MLIEETSFENIDLENERFRISEDLHPPSILRSLKEIGQLNPVLLLEQNGCRTIVCGFRRVSALKRLGRSGVVARILTQNDCDPIRAMHLALWDNLSHRQLNPLESARVISKLRDDFGLTDQELIRNYLPLLGLNPAENVLRNCLLLNRINPALRKCFAQGLATHASIDTLSRMPEPVQGRIAVLFQEIRLSASLQRKFLSLLEDLAAAAGIEPDAPLDNPEIGAVVADPRLSPFQRGEKIYEVLYRLKHPRLSEAADQFAAKKKRLGIPGSIRITAHPFFEEPGLHVEFDAPGPERFRDLAAALYRSAESPDSAGLFEITSNTRGEGDDSV